MSKEHSIVPIERIHRAILLLRGQKVMLDSDLAALYGVPTGALIQAVKRNIARFPEDFTSQITSDEYEVCLKSQFVTSKGHCALSTALRPRPWSGQ